MASNKDFVLCNPAPRPKAHPYSTEVKDAVLSARCTLETSAPADDVSDSLPGVSILASTSTEDDLPGVKDPVR